MTVSLVTWNINSVRLRMPLVERFVAEFDPEVICLQETKCRNGDFPFKALHKLGYEHVAINGQAGYHGVATASRLPFDDIVTREFCDKGDARHVAVTVRAGGEPVTVHNFYVPAGGDEPDREVQRQVRPQARLSDRNAGLVCRRLRPQWQNGAGR